jgi:O-methyltransferase
MPIVNRNSPLYHRWDRLARPWELTAPATFRRGRALHRELWNEGYTMLSSRRGRALHRLACEAARRRVAGALVDCGAWNGGSSILLGAGAPDRPVWVFDSFEGLPAPGALDGSESSAFAGACLGSAEKVRAGFARFLDPARLQLRPGWFEDTLPPAASEIGRIAVLHCDGDWYDSVRLTLEVFYPLVSPGGFVVIDDYGTWPGARLATDEFRALEQDHALLRRVDHTGRWWRKRSASRR